MNKLFEIAHWSELLFILIGFSCVLVMIVRELIKTDWQEEEQDEKESYLPERPLHNPFWGNCFRKAIMVGDFLWTVGVFAFMIFMIVGILILLLRTF